MLTEILAAHARGQGRDASSRVKAVGSAPVVVIVRAWTVRNASPSAPRCNPTYHALRAPPPRRRGSHRSRVWPRPAVWRVCALGQCRALLAQSSRSHQRMHNSLHSPARWCTVAHVPARARSAQFASDHCHAATHAPCFSVHASLNTVEITLAGHCSALV